MSVVCSLVKPLNCTAFLLFFFAEDFLDVAFADFDRVVLLDPAFCTLAVRASEAAAAAAILAASKYLYFPELACSRNMRAVSRLRTEHGTEAFGTMNTNQIRLRLLGGVSPEMPPQIVPAQVQDFEF